jgi:site-specific DNA-methyltransferase (adenine-specific)
VGALNVDGCRIEHVTVNGGNLADNPHLRGETHRATSIGGQGIYSGANPSGGTHTAPSGRWPANVVLDESQADALDQQSGETVSSARPRYNTAEAHNRTVSMGGTNADWTTGGHEDSGGASRFFYTAKADAGERVRVDGTAHPTVKPLSLMRWLVRLVTPPGGTVLEPFAGSGTTVEACILEGFHCIAIEREPDYLPLIVQRVNRQRDPIAYTATAGEDLGLFELFTEGELA